MQIHFMQPSVLWLQYVFTVKYLQESSKHLQMLYFCPQQFRFFPEEAYTTA